MFTRKELVKFLFTVPLLLILRLSYANGIDEFLKQKAVEVDSSEVIDGINRFLNHQSIKEAIWFKGSFLSTKDVRYSNVLMNFNVLDNSLYILNKGRVYRVSNFALKEFDIVQEGEKLSFKKGFAIPSIATISVSIAGSANELIQYLTTYPKFSELQIDDLSITRNQETEMVIKITTGFRDEVTGLKKFIDLNDDVLSSSYEFAASEIKANKYLQVLYEHEKFAVLKYHFKRSAVAEVASVVTSSTSFMFDDEDYYIADASKHLQEFLFTKKSIEKILTSINITSSKKLKNVGSESGAVKWFRTSTFN